MSLQLVQVRRRSAARWPIDVRLDAIAGGASKPRKPHSHFAKQRRDAVSPPVLQVASSAAAHGCRPAAKRPLVEPSPEAASLRARSIPGSQYRQDLPAGRSLSDRCSGSGHHPPSQSTATPIASPFPRSAIDPTDRTSRVVIPPFSYVDGPKFGNVFVRWQHIPVLVPLQFSHKRAPMRETLIGVDEGSGQLRPYVRPVVRRSPRPSWVCAGVSGTDLDSVLKAQENGRYCPSCS